MRPETPARFDCSASPPPSRPQADRRHPGRPRARLCPTRSPVPDTVPDTMPGTAPSISGHRQNRQAHAFRNMARPLLHRSGIAGRIPGSEDGQRSRGPPAHLMAQSRHHRNRSMRERGGREAGAEMPGKERARPEGRPAPAPRNGRLPPFRANGSGNLLGQRSTDNRPFHPPIRGSAAARDSGGPIRAADPQAALGRDASACSHPTPQGAIVSCFRPVLGRPAEGRFHLPPARASVRLAAGRATDTHP